MSRRKKANKNPPVSTRDAYSNPLFRLGYGSQSPLEATEYPLTRMTDNYALLNSLYRDNWIVQNVTEIIPDDMTRDWFRPAGSLTPRQTDRLNRAQRVTGLREKVNEGLRWGRLYGGAAGLILIRGQEGVLDRPLDLETVLPGTFAGLHILDRWCGVMPEPGLVTDLTDPDFGLPEYYDIQAGEGRIAARIHHSRMIRFTGRELPCLERLAELYWGASEVESLYREVVQYDNTTANMAALTFRANVDTMEVQNLDQMFSMSSGEAQRRFWNTMQAQSVMKSNFGMQLVNKGDQIKNTQYAFTGLSDVHESMCLSLSGASRIPMTKLFGRSPAGMNATGESDLQNYYDYVDTLRQSKLAPLLRRLLPILAMSELGAVPEDLDVSFPPLWTPTAKEVAEIAKNKAEAIIAVFQAGLLRADTAQRELKKLSGETDLFDSISDEEIAANKGKTYQDVTALRDPLMGLGYGEEKSGPFEQMTGDALTLDYPGQPREKNGRFAAGKMLTEGGETAKMSSALQNVILPDGSVSRVAEGSKITKIVTFAGKGTDKPLRAAHRLSQWHGGHASDWGKVRGDGYVEVDGIPRHCELHWYEAPQIGRVEMKVKRWF